MKSPENPKGILPQSPGLRGTSYPGYVCPNRSTLKGLWPGNAQQRSRTAPATTPSGLRTSVCTRAPRVARSSQPWALWRNPFGIPRNLKVWSLFQWQRTLALSPSDGEACNIDNGFFAVSNASPLINTQLQLGAHAPGTTGNCFNSFRAPQYRISC